MRLFLNLYKNKRDNTGLQEGQSINGDCEERVHSIRFLGVQISDDLSTTVNTTAVVKKAQQRLHFLRVLRRNNLEERLLVTSTGPP